MFPSYSYLFFTSSELLLHLLLIQHTIELSYLLLTTFQWKCLLVILGLEFQEVQGGTLDIPQPCFNQSSSTQCYIWVICVSCYLEKQFSCSLVPSPNSKSLKNTSSILCANCLIIVTPYNGQGPGLTTIFRQLVQF